MATTRMVPWAMLVALGFLGCAGSRTPVSNGADGSGSGLDLGLQGHYERSPIVVQSADNYIMPMQRVHLRVDPDLSGELLFPHEANAFGQLLTADIDQLIPQRSIRLLDITRSPAGNIVVDLEVTHPFPAPDLNGEVTPLNRADLHANHLRAIFFMDGNESFTIGTETHLVNPGQLVNADGYTDQVPPPTGSGLTATQFPYVVFGTEDTAQLTVGNYHTTDAGGLGWNYVPVGETENFLAAPVGFNTFRQGGVSRAGFEFLADGNPISLDFLLVVNYSPAARSKATRLTPEYFLPANAPQEAWRITVDQTAGGLEAGPAPGDPQFAKTATYNIEVYDWQHGHASDVVSDFPRSNFRVGLAAASDIASVKISIPDVMNSTMSLSVPPILPEDAPDYGAPQTWSFTLDNTDLEAAEGTYYGLIEVVDTRVPDVDLTTIGDSKSVFGVDASTLEFRTLPAFRTYQVFPVTVGEGNVPPVAQAIATSATAVNQGQTVSFATSATDANNDVLTYEWDFDGDGVFGHPVKDNFTGDPTTPTHTFLAPGTPSVNLRVSDGRGGSDTLDAAGVSPMIRIPVTVAAVNIPPQACFTIVSPTTYLSPGALVTFDASCSFDTSVPLIYEWDFNSDMVFGDPVHLSSPAPPVIVTAQFPAVGKSEVRVRVREASTPQLYSTDSAPQLVTVREPAIALTNPTGGTPRYFGKTTAIGDLNNDGLDDLVVAATGFHNVPTEEQPGRVYIYFNDGITPPYPNAPDVIITAAHTGGYSNKGGYGWALDIGDVNGDGYGDIAVGEFQASHGQVFQGYAEVIINGGAAAAPLHFRPSGTAGRPTAIWPAENPTPEGGSESYGNALDLADLNGDGRDDLVVACYAASRPGQHWQAGECYAFHSTGTGFINTAILQKNPYYTADYMGTSITAGDFDGDGDLDVVGGAPGTKVSGVTGVGQIAMWENKMGEAGITAPYYFGGNVSSKNITQNYLGSPPNIVGDGSFGETLKARDLNGDGKWELFVGAPGYNAGNDPVKSGRIFVYAGGPDLMTRLTTPLQQLKSASPKVRAFFGSSFDLGELSDDTFIDIAVGSPFRDETSLIIETGYVEVFKGLGMTFNTVPTVVTPSTQSARGEAGFSVSVGHVYGAGGAMEVVYGAPRQTLYPGGPGRVHITSGPY